MMAIQLSSTPQLTSGSFPTHLKISRVLTLKARELVANVQLTATVNCSKLSGGFYLILSFWRHINTGS